MLNTTPDTCPPPPLTASAICALPETGEALLTAKVLSSALGISESSLWAWAKEDERFPKPVRRGERFTRFKLSEARAYIAGLSEGKAKPMRAQQRTCTEVTQ